ncbi:hypothetical protein EHI8A_036380 [Entamoeba histolytica HM-1:IMSS-B]|uniref:Alpha-type protein kinase domain-containing protein n=4 Tax=Entamoeba histolytica TaxID=5759 RepID=C4M283_ENTH1|nr:hypothetical protein EHI_180330 [Entamoeba histolytica HM-1:IMSS]EAL48445.1 hypothetical protein EHI_180330 [Entamoeba histolytica HM-1:IMSS]EMH75301.1 hypothetical protein EHI8A_036380 [Entamoeba histolytica HM-1:IMSS-B]ENY60509.1 hypothetical protein EHI7A_007790 [Entamoeba histolytica HM-1:IMSS-A]GAT95378.1 hypothetical protein CL6EHI_180330 [Entamoeba histolytica]|eukprot:XP_653831.1 hypothetical protein EHI_180330 [Entamoeba histolytica HM-1:IMSS]
MKSEQEIRQDELVFIRNRIETAKQMHGIIESKEIIQQKEISADVVILFDSIFEQQYVLLNQFNHPQTKICLVYCGNQMQITQFNPYEKALKALRCLSKRRHENSFISLGKVFIELLNIIKWNGIQKHIILVLNKQHSIENELPMSCCSYINTNLKEVSISIQLTLPSLYEQVIQLQQKCFKNSKLILQHDILYPKKPKSNKEESVSGYIIEVPKEYWEEAHFDNTSSPIFYTVHRVNVKRKIECSRWSEDQRLAEYDCFFDGLEGKLMKEMNEERRELAIYFEEILQRSWACYMGDKFNKQVSDEHNTKTIKILPRRLFIQSDTNELFKNDNWNYPKEEIIKRLQGKEIFYIEHKAKGKKIFKGNSCKESLTLECFMHWNYYESKENGIVIIDKGRYHSKSNQYEIEECHIVHNNLLKFFFIESSIKERTFTFFSQHHCNIHCKRMKLIRNKDQPLTENEMFETVMNLNQK